MAGKTHLVKHHHKLQVLGLGVHMLEGGSPVQMLLCPVHPLQGALHICRKLPYAQVLLTYGRAHSKRGLNLCCPTSPYASVEIPGLDLLPIASLPPAMLRAASNYSVIRDKWTRQQQQQQHPFSSVTRSQCQKHAHPQPHAEWALKNSPYTHNPIYYKETLTITKLKLGRFSVFRSTKTWRKASNTCQYEPSSWKAQRTMRQSGARRRLLFQHPTSTSIFRNWLLSGAELQPHASETKNASVAVCQDTACQYVMPFRQTLITGNIEGDRKKNQSHSCHL